MMTLTHLPFPVYDPANRLVSQEKSDRLIRGPDTELLRMAQHTPQKPNDQCKRSETFGSLTLTRHVKRDGRALIMYELRREDAGAVDELSGEDAGAVDELSGEDAGVVDEWHGEDAGAVDKRRGDGASAVDPPREDRPA
jgi:hypothetical protein